MLTYKAKFFKYNDNQKIDILDDGFYISSDLSVLKGVTYQKYELRDGQNILIKSSYNADYVEMPIHVENFIRRGYLSYQKSYKLYTTKIPKSIDLNETIDIKYVIYHDEVYYQNYSGNANIGDGITLSNTIDLPNNPSIDCSGDYIVINDVAYVDDNKCIIDGVTYTQGEDFDLYDGSNNNVITLDNGVNAVVKAYDELQYLTRFEIHTPMQESIAIEDAYTVKQTSFISYKNRMYEVTYKGNTKIAQIYDYENHEYKEVTDSSNSNFFNIDGEDCVINTGFLRADDGCYLCLNLKHDVSLTTDDVLQYETIEEIPKDIYVSSTDNIIPSTIEELCKKEYQVFLNSKLYTSQKDLVYQINVNGSYVDFSLTDEYDNGKRVGYIKLNNVLSKCFVNGNNVTRYVESGNGKYKEEQYELLNIPCFIINDEVYRINLGTTYNVNRQSETFTYISYIGKESGKIIIDNVLTTHAAICSMKFDVEVSNSASQSYGIMNSLAKNIAHNFQSLRFTRANRAFDVEINPSSLSTAVDDSDIDDEPIGINRKQSITLLKPIDYYVMNIPLGNMTSGNQNQEYIVGKDFYEEEKRKRINPIIDMERDIYHPVIYREDIGGCNYPQDLEDVSDIVFNLHFRTRDLSNWNIYDDSTKKLNGWFCTDFPYYRFEDANPITCPNQDGVDEYKPIYVDDRVRFNSSDVLGFLKFTDDDVFYQKSKLANSFIRLSFYDSPNPNNQSLLYYSTIFLDERNLFDKMLKNTKVKNGKIFQLVTNIGFTNEKTDEIEFISEDCCGNLTDSISVHSDIQEDVRATRFKQVEEDIEEKRLSCQFKVKNRYETKHSSDGYYLYIFRDYAMPFTPRSIYMKVEFNHAGVGRTIPFMLPRKFKLNNGEELSSLSPTIAQSRNKKYEIDQNNPNMVFIPNESTSSNEVAYIESTPCSRVDEFKDGFPLKDIYYQQYIELKLIYDKVKQKYCYYVDDKDNNANEKYYQDKKLVFNLWEIKIKDDSED